MSVFAPYLYAGASDNRYRCAQYPYSSSPMSVYILCSYSKHIIVIIYKWSESKSLNYFYLCTTFSTTSRTASKLATAVSAGAAASAHATMPHAFIVDCVVQTGIWHSTKIVCNTYESGVAWLLRLTWLACTQIKSKNENSSCSRTHLHLYMYIQLYYWLLFFCTTMR